MEKLKALIKKFCTREIIFYAIFGVFTTVVNIGTFSLLTYVFHMNENTANAIAICLAVLFAYFTNSYIVFKTKRSNIKERIDEFFKFILGRAFTMIFEIVGFFLMFNILGVTDIISKPFITFLVIIMNYFISKYFAFK